MFRVVLRTKSAVDGRTLPEEDLAKEDAPRTPFSQPDILKRYPCRSQGLYHPVQTDALELPEEARRFHG